ncbi:MAG: hypothetical protein SFT81_04995 [Candidatus Caenarcaniphilales bacterium]|nr:hypothetical protein [Candidatus Caenarcaniphilales bacterium]
MSQIPIPALILMVFCLSGALAIRLNKKTDLPETKLDQLSLLQVTGLVSAVMLALTIWFSLPWTLVAYFIGAILLQAGLTFAPFSSTMRGILLLLTSIGIFHFYAPADFEPLNYLAFVLGLLSFKLTEIWHDLEANSPFVDILPACLWGSAFYLNAYIPDINLLSFAGCSLSLAILIQAISSFFAKETLFVIIAKLSIATAGAFLIASLLALKISWAIPALLFAGAIVMFEVFKHFDGQTGHTSTAQSALFKLGAVILVILVASRFIGAWGWLISASGALATGALASNGKFMLFLVMRTLLQGYILNYNPNVTGVNLLHPYSGAALFMGLVLVTFAPFYINFLKGQKIGLLVFVFKCVLIAICSSYFLHAEATGALLISLNCMTAISIVMSHSKEPRPNISPIISIASGIIIVFATICADQFLNLGETSTKTIKLIFLGVLAVLILGSFWQAKKNLEIQIPANEMG